MQTNYDMSYSFSLVCSEISIEYHSPELSSSISEPAEVDANK